MIIHRTWQLSRPAPSHRIKAHGHDEKPLSDIVASSYKSVLMPVVFDITSAAPDTTTLSRCEPHVPYLPVAIHFHTDSDKLFVTKLVCGETIVFEGQVAGVEFMKTVSRTLRYTRIGPGHRRIGPGRLAQITLDNQGDCPSSLQAMLLGIPWPDGDLP